MHVTSEEGNYSFKRNPPHAIPSIVRRNDFVEKLDDDDSVTPSMAVCGLYVVTDPGKLIEITIKKLDVSCESGGLMAVKIFLNIYLKIQIYLYVRKKINFSLLMVGN